MFGFLTFILTLTSGYVLLSWCLPKTGVLFRWTAGGILGIALGAWVAFALAVVLGTAVAMYLLLAIFVLISVIGWRTYKWQSPDLGFFELLFLSITALVVVYLYFSHALSVQPNGWYVPGYTWGDIALHMSLISSVAYQPHVPLHFPVFYQAPLSYPFLFDFYSGILLRLGLSWQMVFFLPSTYLFLAAAALAQRLVTRITGKRAVGYINLALFFLAGSTAGLSQFFSSYATLGSQAFTAFDYSYLPDQGLDLANPVTSHFLPQRSFLVGFALAILIFSLLYDAIKSREGNGVYLAAFLTGTLPFFHVNTFFVVAAVWVTWIVSEWIRRKHIPRHWLYASLILFGIALPQVLWQFHSSYHAGFGYWYLGWTRPIDQSLLYFWLRNVSIFLGFLVGLPWIIRKMHNEFFTALVIVATGITIAINVRIFQPFAFDNLKFFFYAYWIFSIAIAWVLVEWWNRRYWYLTIVSLFLLCGSGTLSIIREMQPSLSYELFSNSDLHVASELRSVIPADAHVLTYGEHNNIVPTLTGRSILVGYDGWLWSYGISYLQEVTDRNTIISGGAGAADLIKKYDLNYLVVSEEELDTNGVNLSQVSSQYREVYADSGWHVYQLQ